MHNSSVIIQPMNADNENFYNIWEMILSRQSEVVRQAFNGLDEGEQKAVLEHLQRMQSESGWQPSQRESAQAALEAILDVGDDGSENLV